MCFWLRVNPELQSKPLMSLGLSARFRKKDESAHCVSLCETRFLWNSGIAVKLAD